MFTIDAYVGNNKFFYASATARSFHVIEMHRSAVFENNVIFPYIAPIQYGNIQKYSNSSPMNFHVVLLGTDSDYLQFNGVQPAAVNESSCGRAHTIKNTRYSQMLAVY